MTLEPSWKSSLLIPTRKRTSGLWRELKKWRDIFWKNFLPTTVYDLKDPIEKNSTGDHESAFKKLVDHMT